MKKLLSKGLAFLNNRLSRFEKIIYFLLVTSLIVVTLISWIQTYPYYFALIIGLILFLIGIYSFITTYIQSQGKFINVKENNNNSKNYNNKINIKNGNYNELIQGSYIQGDYINIQNQSVDISEDVSQILEELQNILTNLIYQGSTIEEAVNKIATDLEKESRKNPEIKSKFLIDEDTNDSEFKEEFITLLINNYLSISKTQFSSNYDDNKNSNDYQEIVNYRGYTIYFETDKDGKWHYKIDGLLYDNTGEWYNKSSAINEAKGKIDEERFSKW
jgi:hypothetical protein